MRPNTKKREGICPLSFLVHRKVRLESCKCNSPVDCCRRRLDGGEQYICAQRKCNESLPVYICESKCNESVCGARRMSLARTPASLADRGTRCALTVSATGSARARGPSGVPPPIGRQQSLSQKSKIFASSHYTREPSIKPAHYTQYKTQWMIQSTASFIYANEFLPAYRAA